jgi:hypothetical protein
MGGQISLAAASLYLAFGMVFYWVSWMVFCVVLQKAAHLVSVMVFCVVLQKAFYLVSWMVFCLVLLKALKQVAITTVAAGLSSRAGGALAVSPELG